MTSAGKTTEIEIQVVLHRGSLYVRDNFRCDHGRDLGRNAFCNAVRGRCATMEVRLERLGEYMEKNGLKVTRTKTEQLQTT